VRDDRDIAEIHYTFRLCSAKFLRGVAQRPSLSQLYSIHSAYVRLKAHHS